MTFRKLMAGAVMAGVAFCGLAATSNAGEYDGITLNLLTRPGPVIAGRLAERGKEFEAATGAKVVVTEVPVAEIFQKVQTDWTTGMPRVGALPSGSSRAYPVFRESIRPASTRATTTRGTSSRFGLRAATRFKHT